jgi:hypothetical protein
MSRWARDALVSLSFPRVGEAIYDRCLVLGSEMGVAHCYLQRPVPKQLCHHAQIHSSHNQFTGKSVPVAIPGIPLDLGLFGNAAIPSLLTGACTVGSAGIDSCHPVRELIGS